MGCLDTDGAELLDRITVRPDIFDGKPVIRGLRIAVEHILAMLAAGDTPETVLREFPDLRPADIQACLSFCAPFSRGRASSRPNRHPGGSVKASSMSALLVAPDSTADD